MPTNKSLGQHWLTDRVMLSAIADAADIQDDETVLEIGPGLGTLTSELLRRAKQVIAVEFDAELAKKLPGQFPGTQLTVLHQDILQYSLATLPKNYKVVANVPYYITSKIVQKLLTDKNQPRVSVLLVQKEVAQRIAAEPGELSILAISAQVFAHATLETEVPKSFFTPPPKVDSQVVVLTRRSEPMVAPGDQAVFFRVVKAGFSAKRKKLRTSLAGGLGLSKVTIHALLEQADVSGDVRAQDVSIPQWMRIADAYAQR